MQFTKTSPMNAGKRAPTTIDIADVSKLAAGGSFKFIDGNTLHLTLEDGTVVVLFVSRGYSYTEVKPVEDALSQSLKAAGISPATGEAEGSDTPAVPPVDAGATATAETESSDDTTDEAEADSETVSAGAGVLDGPLMP